MNRANALPRSMARFAPTSEDMLHAYTYVAGADQLQGGEAIEFGIQQFCATARDLGHCGRHRGRNYYVTGVGASPAVAYRRK